MKRKAQRVSVPLAGLSCINRTLRRLRLVRVMFIRFRPLAGLSCINRFFGWFVAQILAFGFRPLAGLSCINP